MGFKDALKAAIGMESEGRKSKFQKMKSLKKWTR